ncbi:hypothetical protein H6P81_007316 [Aristolochia fimbriata]|uniref:Uncharacterized protein n=1 Tax=Aristolochia fimbriata TaxID=158543 RepID=A0AAV7F3P2_ARIFI|nr:hypothetical protein H6P81_007316 [Aristolochia fimbriata]
MGMIRASLAHWITSADSTARVISGGIQTDERLQSEYIRMLSVGGAKCPNKGIKMKSGRRPRVLEQLSPGYE